MTLLALPENTEETEPAPRSALQPSTPTSASKTRAKAAPPSPVSKALLAVIIQALQTGDPVSLPGIGALSVRTYPARTGRNPRTGETIHIPAGSKVRFKMAASLRERLNRDA